MINQKRILLIDEEHDIKTLARFCLEFEADWQMIDVTGATEGIAIAQTHQPDAILVDTMMPKDGLKTLKKLHSNPQTKHIPTLMIIARDKIIDRRLFYRAGAKGIIYKPFSTLTLASQISGFLGWYRDCKQTST